MTEKQWDYVEKSEAEEKELKEAMKKGQGEEEESAKTDYDAMSKDDLIKAVIKAKQEASKNWDEFVRAKAEVQNVLHSAEKEKHNIRNFVLKSFVQSLISVVDNFERSMDTVSQDKAVSVSVIIEGVELARKDLLSALEKFGVEALNPLHEKFNPEFHEAMALQPSTDHGPNIVLQVLQKGYTINKRLVRPAMVIVSNA